MEPTKFKKISEVTAILFFGVLAMGLIFFIPSQAQNENFSIAATSCPAPDDFTLTLAGSAATPIDPIGFFVSGNRAYTLTTQGTAGSVGGSVQVWDISKPSADPKLLSSFSTGERGPRSIYVSGGYAYVTQAHFTDGKAFHLLKIFDLSNPEAAATINTTSQGNPNSVFVSGNRAYVTNLTGNTLQVFDVSTPLQPFQPAEKSSIITDAKPQYVHVSGQYAYVVSSKGTYTAGSLQVFDVSNPAKLILAGSINAGRNPTHVHVSGKYAYVTEFSSSKLLVFDISKPTTPKQVASINTNRNARAVTIAGRYAYVTTSLYQDELYGSLQVFDVLDPTKPKLVGSFGTDTTTLLGREPSSYGVGGRQSRGDPRLVYVSGRHAYVNDLSTNTILVIDVATCPAVPPTAVTDLFASNPTETTVHLTWTAPADAVSEEIRCSISPITEDNWDSAVIVN